MDKADAKTTLPRRAISVGVERYDNISGTRMFYSPVDPVWIR